jgi:hypothetical protein
MVKQVEDLTLVYDAGQNSGDNHALVEGSQIGFVDSLPPSDYPDLLAVPMPRYRIVDADRFPGLSYVDTAMAALSVTRRAVLTHSQTLHDKRPAGSTRPWQRPSRAASRCRS